MSPDEAILACLVSGQIEALRSLVEAGVDSDSGLGRVYLAQSRRADNTKTATDPTLQKIIMKKDTTNMDTTEAALLGFAKGLVAGDSAYGLTRQDFEAGITMIAKRDPQPGESEAQAFTRIMTLTPEGQLLFKASLRAPGAEPKAPEPEEEPPSRGEAHDEMQRRADRYHAANPHLSAARAYTDVYSARENADLRNRVIAEHLSPRPRAPAARRLNVEMSNPDRLAAARALRTRGP